MVIQLKRPTGPGIPAPNFLDDDRSWRETSFFDDPGLRRVLDAPYYEDFIKNTLSPDRPGSIEGGPTFSQAWDILHPDPRKWSTIEAPRSLVAPIMGDLGTGAGGDASSKLGRFNLNLIHPFDSLREGITEGLGQDVSGYDPFSLEAADTIFGDITVSPMDVLNWSAETPVKLIERPLAFLSVISNRLLGTPIPLDDEGSAVYPFQKDPAYWAWLRQATDEQVTQFARSQAGKYLAVGRNEQLFNALLSRFQQDRDSLSGLSSGSSEVDWHAKMAAWNASRGWPGQGGYNTANPFGGPVGTLIGSVPFIGINLQSWIDPVTPEIEANWQSLSVQQRQYHLELQGYVLVGKNLIGMVPTFNGAAAIGMAAKASSVPTIARMAQAWGVTLKTANILMATGVGISTAAWAAEVWAPKEWAEFGRDVNLAAPISHDATAALILSNIGGFASGTFGAALLARSVKRVGSLGANRANLSGRVWGTSEIPFYGEGFGGSPYRDILKRVAGVEPQVSELAVKAALKSYFINASEADRLAVYRGLTDGTSTHPALDALSPADRDAWIANDLARAYSSRGARVAMMLERFERVRRSLPLLPSSDDIAVHAATKMGVRRLVDESTHDLVRQYGPEFFGASVPEIRGRIEKDLTELGYAPDMAALDAALGRRDTAKTAQRWLPMARLVHQIGYVTENGRLRAAIDMQPASAETGLALFSQRTPFLDEMIEAIDTLRGEPGAARAYARELVNSKTSIGRLYALGEFRDATRTVADPDPIHLADHIQHVIDNDGFPARRIQATDPATVDEPLNRFHRDLVAKGKWELGFRAKREITSIESYAAALERELSPREFATLEPSRVTLVDVVPEGYVELLPGQRFKRTNWYALKLIQTHEGRIYALDDGTLHSASTPNVPPPVTRPTNDPANPQPFDPYASTAAAEADSQLPAAQQVLVREVNRSGGNFTLVPPDWDLIDSGQVMSGRNAGADWPVLDHRTTGTKWLFKARRTGGEDLADLSPPRRLAGPTATKLFTYFGLRTAEEVPYTWGGVKGTLQQLVEVDSQIELGSLDKYTPEVHAELVKHHIVDWLTGQHDSNSDSFLQGADGHVYGIDKGQAYKYFSESEPNTALHSPEEFWTFRTRDALDTHLGEFLFPLIQQGKIKARWSDLEPLLRAIDDLPEDIYLAALKPLAEARVADGRFETSVDTFYAAAIERKRSIRAAVRNAFSRYDYATLGRADEPPTFAPGARGLIDIGTPTQLNEPPIPLVDLIKYNEASPVSEPSEPAGGIQKAGAVVLEPDGRVWILAPKGNFGGYSHTWPKGRIDAGESYQAAAIREVFEETGLSVRLREHLADLPNDQGHWTRYYIADRIAGGPEFITGKSAKEVGVVRLVSEAEAPGMLYRNGQPDPRDNQLLDALIGKRLQRQAEASGPAAPPPDEPGPVDTDAAEPAAEMGYVGHVRLRNGEVWPTPWLDADVTDASAINLGNRGVLGRAFDGVFHGWRAWRIMEQQKLNLHHRLTREYEITPSQVEQFHTELLALSRKYRGVSMQALAGIAEEIPVIGRMQADVKAAAAAVFGEGPFLNKRTGRVDGIDFHKEVVRAYRQSLRLNVLAGVTSNLKAIPGIGNLVIPVTDVIYPLFRYALSFIFKPSELTESAILNAGRGVQYSGDPFIDAQYARAGFGAGSDILMGEVGGGAPDLMLQGMTAFSTTLGQRGRFGEDPAFFLRLDPREMAKRVAGEIAPAEPFTPGAPRSTLADSLEGGPLELPDPVKYPDLYHDRVRHLLRQVDVDAEGNPVLQLNGGEQTARQVAAHRDRILAELLGSTIRDPDFAARLGAGFAVLRNLPPGTIERLAEAIPLLHTPMTRAGAADKLGRQLGFIQEAIAEGNPLFPGNISTGKYDLALYESITGQTVPTAERVTGDVTSTSITSPEQWVGFADAKYGSLAADYGAGYGGLMPVLKPEALRESITVDTDRFVYANNIDVIQDAMMTPAAVNGITRLVGQRMVLDWAARFPEMTFLEFLNARGDLYFQAVEPFEFAYMDGIGVDQMAGIMIPADEIARWTDLVGNNPDVPGLADLPIIPYDKAVGYKPSMWANALERAGLLDLANSRPDDYGLPGYDEALLSLPIEILVGSIDNPTQSAWLADQIKVAAMDAGFNSTMEYGPADVVRLAVNEERLQLRQKEAMGKAFKKTPTRAANSYSSFTSETPSTVTTDISVGNARIRELERLATDWDELFQQGFSSEEAALAAAGSSDATTTARGLAWLDAYNALEARLTAMGLPNGPGFRYKHNGAAASRVQVLDMNTAEVLLERPTQTGDLPLHFTKGGGQYDANTPWEIDRARALLEVYQTISRPGYAVRHEGYISSRSSRAILEAVSLPEFRGALRARAQAKLGVDLGEPVVRAYLRGPARRLAPAAYSANNKGVDQLIIVVQDGSGQPYGGLSMPELNDLWQQYGLPATFRERTAATGFDPHAAGRIADPNDLDAGFLMHGPGSTPEGRAYFYTESSYSPASIKGTWNDTPTGKVYVDDQAPLTADISFAHSFEPAGQSYVELDSGRVFWRQDVETQVQGRSTFVSRSDRHGDHDWRYQLHDAADGVRESEIIEVNVHADGKVTLRMDAIRDMIGRIEERPVRLKLQHGDDRMAFDRLALRGEIPDWLVAVDNMGAVVDRPAIARTLNPGAAAVPIDPPPTSFTDVTPEGRLTDRIRDELSRIRTKAGRAAHAAFLDPIPYKQRQMDRLTFKLMRDRFAPLLREEAPAAAQVFDEIGVPDGRRLDFLVHDRYLLDRWLQTGARADWGALVEHAARYTGKADYQATRQGLDELYTSPEFDTVLETLRLAMKGSQDEAYQVHFFSPYRSTLERSINHPLLGIYPASWAYKVAKEWIRFLYNNETLGFRIGMTPAMAIQQAADDQAKAFAQDSDRPLDDWYENGPYRNSIFIFNLLMPGDWSSLPFPASRTIRDAARGNVNLYDIFERNISSIGAGRDIRLTLGAGDELIKTVTGEIGQGEEFREAGVPSRPGWSLFGDQELPVTREPEAPREIFQWR